MKLEGLRTVLHEVGVLLMIVALVPVAAMPVALAAGDAEALLAFAVTGLLFLFAGLLLYAIRRGRAPTQRHAMMIAAVGWLVVPLLSVPPMIMLEGMPFLDAYFEMMSGWTGTGLSLLLPEETSASALWWRSTIQWVGGVGVIVLTITVLARPGSAAYALYKGEAREEKLRPNVVGTVRAIWWIYAVYTAAIIAALVLLAQLPFWDAVNHALTAISTAGFSIYNDSLTRYGPTAIAIIVVAMILGATPFVAHYPLLKGNVRKFLQDVQFRWMMGILAAGFVVTLLLLLNALPEEAFSLALFQWASAVTSTGFQTTPFLAEWPDAAKIFLALGMIVGGSAGSTAGGIKIVRAALLARGVAWKIRRASLPPFAVASFRFGPRTLRADEANQEFAEAAFVTFLWVIAVHVLLFSLLSIGVDVENAIFESASVISNNGMSVGVTSPDLPAWVKGVFMFGMWAGRLEIFPVLILLRSALRPGRQPG